MPADQDFELALARELESLRSQVLILQCRNEDLEDELAKTMTDNERLRSEVAEYVEVVRQLRVRP